MTKKIKVSKQNKEQNEYKSLNKKQRELTGELKKLKKENARLRKMANRPQVTEEAYEEEPAPPIDIKKENAVTCSNCNGSDIAEIITSYNKKVLCVCRGCSFKWSRPHEPNPSP